MIFTFRKSISIENIKKEELKDSEFFRLVSYKGVYDIRVNASGTRVIGPDSKEKSVYWLSNGKYAFVTVGGKKMYVHILVARAFLPSSHELNEFVIHVDGNFRNNSYKNLVYGTKRDSEINKIFHGRYVNNSMKRLNSRIPIVDEEKIFERLMKGEACRSIAREYNTSDMSLIRLKKKMIKKQMGKVN